MDDSIKSYMSHAESDLITAEKLVDDESDIRGRAFHSQQAAENAMKAVIAASGRKPVWTHDLVSLANDLPSGCDAGASDPALAILADYATTPGYGSTLISKKDADAALNTARNVVDAMRASLQ